MKHLKAIGLLLVIGILLSCASTSSTTSGQNTPPDDTKYKIGDIAHGGIIFMVNPEGTHGLVAALQDQMVNSDYNECSELINDPRNHDDLGKNYFDWRLPKLWEAYKMYMNLHLVNLGGFSNSGYWTGKDGNTFDKAHVLSFAKGIDFASLKTDTYRARAVRSF